MPAPSPGRKRVPRWRTMISPPVTTWPAKIFTPRRFAFESRPLRLEPRPFLCAISGPPARRDARDLQACELLPVPGGALVPALGLELEDAQLRPALVAEHGGLDPDAAEIGLREERAVAAGVEQRLEIDGGALVGGQALDEERGTLLDAVLLAARADDGGRGLRHRSGHSLASETSVASAAAFARERRRPPLRPRRRDFDCTVSSSVSPSSPACSDSGEAAWSSSCDEASSPADTEVPSRSSAAAPPSSGPGASGAPSASSAPAAAPPARDRRRPRGRAASDDAGAALSD